MSTGVGNELTELQPDLLAIQDVHEDGYDDQQQATNEGAISSCNTHAGCRNGCVRIKGLKETHCKAIRDVSCHIIQCYLPPDTGERAPP